MLPGRRVEGGPLSQGLPQVRRSVARRGEEGELPEAPELRLVLREEAVDLLSVQARR